MVDLNKLKINSKAITEGEWIRIGDEYGDLEIKTRGFTDLYTNHRNGALGRAARGFGGDTTKVPVEIVRRITIDCMVEHVILDVRNLTDGKAGDDGGAGDPVPFSTFVGLLRNPDYVLLLNACIQAANQVGMQRADDLDTAVGNLPPPSASASTPQATDT